MLLPGDSDYKTWPRLWTYWTKQTSPVTQECEREREAVLPCLQILVLPFPVKAVKLDLPLKNAPTLFLEASIPPVSGARKGFTSGFI